MSTEQKPINNHGYEVKGTDVYLNGFKIAERPSKHLAKRLMDSLVKKLNSLQTPKP